MSEDPDSAPGTLGERLANRWESLPGRFQFAIAYPTTAIVLFVIHISLFHRLSVARCIGYAVFEGLVFTGLLLVATLHERTRKVRAAMAAEQMQGKSGQSPD